MQTPNNVVTVAIIDADGDTLAIFEVQPDERLRLDIDGKFAMAERLRRALAEQGFAMEDIKRDDLRRIRWLG